MDTLVSQYQRSVTLSCRPRMRRVLAFSACTVWLVPADVRPLIPRWHTPCTHLVVIIAAGTCDTGFKYTHRTLQLVTYTNTTECRVFSHQGWFMISSVIYYTQYSVALTAQLVSNGSYVVVVKPFVIHRLVYKLRVTTKQLLKSLTTQIELKIELNRHHSVERTSTAVVSADERRDTQRDVK